MNASGRARVDTEILDLSILIDTGLKGIHAFLGKTERGPIGSSVLVGSWPEYQKTFGGLLADSAFPLMCKRALERGGTLRISRAGHYTATVLQGAPATNTTSSIDVDATSIGTWGNGLTITAVAARNSVAGEFDVTVSLAGYPELDTTVYNIPATLTALAISKMNNSFELVNITAIVGDVLAAGTETLAGGVQVLADIVEADYIGAASNTSGLHAFDEASDFTRLSIPEMAIPTLDIAIVAYVEMRKDCRAILRTPMGISGTVAIDYRNGTGTYSHAAIDTWRASMIFGGLKVVDPLTSAETITPALADVAGSSSVKDNDTQAWFSGAGPRRGVVKNALGIDYNLASPARTSEADLVDIHGINPVVNDTDYGLVYWGNSTLQKKDTLLKHENVAELMIFLSRMIGPIVKSELFEPNDIETWQGLYRNLRPALEIIKDNRGIWDYLYQGDQFIDDISQATVNTPASVDAGQYIFNLWVAPKVGLKYIGAKITVTNSGVDFEELSGQPSV